MSWPADGHRSSSRPKRGLNNAHCCPVYVSIPTSYQHEQKYFNKNHIGIFYSSQNTRLSFSVNDDTLAASVADEPHQNKELWLFLKDFVTNLVKGQSGNPGEKKAVVRKAQVRVVAGGWALILQPAETCRQGRVIAAVEWIERKKWMHGGPCRVLTRPGYGRSNGA